MTRRLGVAIVIGLVLLVVCTAAGCDGRTPGRSETVERESEPEPEPEPEQESVAVESSSSASSEDGGTGAAGAQLRATIDASVSGAAAARDYYGDVVAVGPALWARLTSADPGLEGEAIPTTCLLPGDPPVQYRAGTFQADSVPALLDSPAFLDLCTDLAGGQVRASTAFERDVYYAQVPYEIGDKDIYVIEYGGDVLLVDFLDGKAVWLEMVSDWVSR